jgi:hypothetical protein
MAGPIGPPGPYRSRFQPFSRASSLSLSSQALAVHDVDVGAHGRHHRCQAFNLRLPIERQEGRQRRLWNVGLLRAGGMQAGQYAITGILWLLIVHPFVACAFVQAGSGPLGATCEHASIF